MKRPTITQYIQPSLNKSKLEKAKPYKLYLKSQNPFCRIKTYAAAKKKEKKKGKKKGSRLGSPHSSKFSDQMRSDGLDRRKLKPGNQQQWRERMREAESKS